MLMESVVLSEPIAVKGVALPTPGSVSTKYSPLAIEGDDAPPPLFITLNNWLVAMPHLPDESW
jgi:hypothetical protein